jgi:hypothetical protein
MTRTLNEIKQALSGGQYSKAVVHHHGAVLGWFRGSVDLDDVFSLISNETARGTLTVQLDDKGFIVKDGKVVHFV